MIQKVIDVQENILKVTKVESLFNNVWKFTERTEPKIEIGVTSSKYIKQINKLRKGIIPSDHSLKIFIWKKTFIKSMNQVKHTKMTNNMSTV